MKLWSELKQSEKIERWENALRVLSSLTPHERRKHWNMSVFGEKTECGTVACAAGHCGLDPWFRRRGLQLNFEQLYPTTERFYAVGQDHATSFEDYIDDFFGPEGSNEIFYNGLPRPVSAVIKEVKKYIKVLEEQEDEPA
jgi:hypothetical protein